MDKVSCKSTVCLKINFYNIYDFFYENVFFRSLWTCIVAWTEALAQGTDYLRVDFFVNDHMLYQQANVQCIVSEMNAFPWPHSTFFQGTLELQRKAYLKGLVSENSA